MLLASTVNVPPKDREILTFWTRSTSLKAGLAAAGPNRAAGSRGVVDRGDRAPRGGVQADGDRVEAPVRHRGPRVA